MVYSETELADMSYAEVQEVCRDLEISASGKKAALVKRIIAKQVEIAKTVKTSTPKKESASPAHGGAARPVPPATPPFKPITAARAVAPTPTIPAPKPVAIPTPPPTIPAPAVAAPAPTPAAVAPAAALPQSLCLSCRNSCKEKAIRVTVCRRYVKNR